MNFPPHQIFRKTGPEPSFAAMGVLTLGVALALALAESILAVVLLAPQAFSMANRMENIFPRQLLSATVVAVVCLGALWLVVAGAGSRLKWKHWSALLFAVLMFVLFLDLLDFSDRFRLSASGILALGLAFQLTRWFVRHNRSFLLWGKRLAIGLSLVVALCLTGSALADWVVERRAAGQLPPSRADAPNVLLIVADTLRADAMSAYGYPKETTPFLDSLAEHGVLFERAFAPSSWSLTSHASLMTGRFPFEHRIRNQRGELVAMDGRHRALAEAFQGDGYATAGFVANPWYCSAQQGFSRGFLRYRNASYRFDSMLHRTGIGARVVQHLFPLLGWNQDTDFVSSRGINRQFLNWLDGVAGRPFFVFLNYMDAHSPLVPPREFAAKFSREPDKLMARKPLNFLDFHSHPDSEELRKMELDAYAASVAYLDANIANLFRELERRGATRNLIVVFTSDHGESFGEHDLYGHRSSLYSSMVQVPLIVSHSGVVPSQLRVPSPVSLQAVAATLVELARVPGSNPFPGPSLTGAWTNPAQWIPGPVLLEVAGTNFEGGPSHWPVRKGWLKSLVVGPWQLILREDGQVELFDLINEPDQTRNLAELPENRRRVESMRQQLEALVPEARSAAVVKAP